MIHSCFLRLLLKKLTSFSPIIGAYFSCVDESFWKWRLYSNKQKSVVGIENSVILMLGWSSWRWMCSSGALKHLICLVGPFRMSPHWAPLPSSSCLSSIPLWMWRDCGREPHSSTQVNKPLKLGVDDGDLVGQPRDSWACLVLRPRATVPSGRFPRCRLREKAAGATCRTCLACSKAVHPFYLFRLWGHNQVALVSSGNPELWSIRINPGHIIQFLMLQQWGHAFFLSINVLPYRWYIRNIKRWYQEINGMVLMQFYQKTEG